MKKSKALIIGRFQPLHNGHVKLVEFVDGLNFSRIIIAVGYGSKDERHPWGILDVSRMFSTSLYHINTPMSLISVRDLGYPPGYAAHVEKIAGISEEDTTIVSGNNYVIDCFRNEEYGKQYDILDVRNEGLDSPDGISGTQVRELILNGDNLWELMVPKGTYDIIKSKGYPLQGER